MIPPDLSTLRAEAERLRDEMYRTLSVMLIQAMRGDVGSDAEVALQIGRWADRLDAVLSQLLAAIPSPSQQGWQPIKTGPKDGRPVLLWLDEPLIGRAIPSPYGEYWVRDDSGKPVRPTHWMPLPTPPQAIPSPSPGESKG